jgi:hypothetical protein
LVEEFILYGIVAVGEGVVVSAEEDQIFEFGFASVGPVDFVVGVTPSGGASAPGVLAMAVPGDQSTP